MIFVFQLQATYCWENKMNEDFTEVIGIFPTPLYFALCQKDVAQAVEFLDTAKLKLNNAYENVQAYGSISEDTYILDNPECKLLRDFIITHLEIYAREVLAYRFEKIELTQSWVSVKDVNEQHTYHRHPNSLISGCFYWQEPPFEPLSFLRPSKITQFEICRDAAIENDFAWDFYKVNPRKNTLLLFPSYLKHGVDKNSFSTPRKSLAFNSMIIGKVGSNPNLSELDFNRL